MTSTATKRPANRPRLEQQAQRRRNISLSDAQAERAKALSRTGDNLSEGIRRAIEIATARTTA